MRDRTIAAISTPLGPGGIGIIRISGSSAENILQRLFVRGTASALGSTSPAKATRLQSHRVYYGHIQDIKSGTILDEVLAIFMKGPKSFTREDIVEIHSHSGYVVLDRILNAVIDAGAHLAEPGAFTKRAFLNGRIDLSQAEAVIDLINAPCETAVHMASRQMAGGLKDAVARMAATLYGLRARAEAAIDFTSEVDGGELSEEIRGTLDAEILNAVVDLIQKHKESAVFRDGAALAIAGTPNVGKSSLLNRIVEKETAIVSEIPGTTRDVVREYCSIKGVPVIICDTAGIHPTDDPVETLGIQKAKEQILCADVVLLVVEATRALNAYEESLVNDADPRKTILVINKDDIGIESTVNDLMRRVGHLRHVRVSAKRGDGIERLKQMIFNDLVSERQMAHGLGPAPNLRQRKILENIREVILNDPREKMPPLELLADRLGRVIDLLEDVVGKRGNEALYDDIFSQFCIGK